MTKEQTTKNNTKLILTEEEKKRSKEIGEKIANELVQNLNKQATK
jgi:hypothetical protein